MRYRIRKVISYGEIVYYLESKVWYSPFWSFVTLTLSRWRAEELIREMEEE